MKSYNDKSVYYADLHTHCNMSYAHGSLEDALNNAALRLDAVSVTGHAHWPDMPGRDGKIDHIIDFHEKGFTRLKEGWAESIQTMRKHNGENLTVYPGFEIHSMDAGDYTIISRDFDLELMYPESIDSFRQMLEEDDTLRDKLLPFPHHIGYKEGRRGINWKSFNGNVFPLVEMYSMHGCSETDENDLPFLHTMGPLSETGTVRYGLSKGGAKFGVIANTDHHSAHPGSYGHGFTGVWAEKNTRESIWQAMKDRRTFAISADKMKPAFSVNGRPMGSEISLIDDRIIEFDVKAGGAIDYVDIIKNGGLYKRVSQNNIMLSMPENKIKTIIYLEAGWGERNKKFSWNIQLAINKGTVTGVDARFRGGEVVSPLDKTDADTDYTPSSWKFEADNAVSFRTVTAGNPTNSTCATQGLAVEIDAEKDAVISCNVNGKDYSISLERLMNGPFVEYAGGFDSPAFKIHKAPLPKQFLWNGSFLDRDVNPAYYYLRVRQKNGSWGWTSPVWVE